jgi:hypothetical protein
MALRAFCHIQQRKTERGQSMAFFAVVMLAVSVFAVGIVDYMITNARVMEAVAAADLSAHAGAQEVIVLNNGTLTVGNNGNAIAAAYFTRQAPAHTRLLSVSCGRFDNRPACRVTVSVRSAGYLIPTRWITVNAVGYMAAGVTHEDQ